MRLLGAAGARPESRAWRSGQRQCNRLRVRHGAKKAVCAVAASLLTAVYHMLKDGTEHQDLGANHFDRRSVDIKAKRPAAQIAKLGFQVELRPLPEAA
jgi:transposase